MIYEKFYSYIVDLFNRDAINKTFESFVKNNVSRYFIPLYINKYKINKSEIKKPLDEFKNLQEFFTREIDLSHRPIANSKYTSPCDGFISETGDISNGKYFVIKDKVVDIKTLIGKEDNNYKSFQLIYLSPKDYHRFHAISDGTFKNIYSIGEYSLPVNDLGFKLGNPILRNKRVIMEHKDYLYIAIGAVNVNSIEINKTQFEKGDEIGMFKMGSTILILYREKYENLSKGKIKVRESLLK